LTWDILFLIPVVWLGPVLAPVICAFTMILLGLCILYFQSQGRPGNLDKREWILLLTGSAVIIIAFIWDYMRLVIEGGYLGRVLSLAHDPQFQQIYSQYVPDRFQWLIFFPGEIMLLTAIGLFCFRMIRFKGGES
jgi:hypothetical protein